MLSCRFVLVVISLVYSPSGVSESIGALPTLWPQLIDPSFSSEVVQYQFSIEASQAAQLSDLGLTLVPNNGVLHGTLKKAADFTLQVTAHIGAKNLCCNIPIHSSSSGVL